MAEQKSIGGTKTWQVESACPLDCPDGCSLVATLQETAQGKRLLALDGTARNPLTQGLVCAKVREFAQHLYSDARVPYPLVREEGAPKGQPGGLRRASWDEALELIVDKLTAVRTRHGGQSILPLHYDGSNGALSSGLLDQRLFRRLGATKLEKTVCAAPTGAAALGLYGKMPGIALEDYEHAQLIVAWGVNPAATGIHFMQPVVRAQKRGAKLVVIDPVRTGIAKRADVHLALRPGTDLVLALAVIRWLVRAGHADLEFLEENSTGFKELKERSEAWTPQAAARVTGLTERQIEDFAALYARSSPAALRCGWGLERNRNGGQAVAAVLALPAVAGKFGVRAGGYTLSNNAAWNLVDLNEDEPAPVRAVNQNRVGQALSLKADGKTSGAQSRLGPPIEFVFIFDHNPAETLPNLNLVRRGLTRPDLFCVVFDAVMTVSTQYADVVLPATTFLEHHELVKPYGAFALQRTRPVVDPVGEARSNLDVFAELIRRLGLEQPNDSTDPDLLVSQLLAREEQAQRDLERDGIAFPSGEARPIQFIDVHPRTPDGRIHLFPPELDAESPVGLYVYREDPGTESYPLSLVSPALARTISSTFGQLHRDIVPLQMHPTDADHRGIADGEHVRVFNELGELQTSVRVTEDVRPGVVLLPKGLWSHNTLDGNTSNMLTPDALTDLGGGAVFNDTRVDVEPLGPRV